MMTSQHGARISRFRKISFMNEYRTSEFLLFLILIFLSTLVHEIRVWVLFRANFGLMMLPKLNWVKTSKFWESGFINGYFTSKYLLLLLIFVFLSTLVNEIPIWIIWPIFCDMVTLPQGVKTSNFEIVLSKTIASPQICV